MEHKLVQLITIISELLAFKQALELPPWSIHAELELPEHDPEACARTLLKFADEMAGPPWYICQPSLSIVKRNMAIINELNLFEEAHYDINSGITTNQP
jgi:hypothetical protein